ncbi:MAG TPA: nucleotidyltransferase domain-containing protein [Candidatus Binatia bacterium]|nr:nucleotidyltransferase domain-containing protein [Candidatus Binatia bacterium]
MKRLDKWTGMKLPRTREAEISKIVRQVVDAYRPEKIILFGSYAYGKPNADSDLDLLIIKETSERFIDRWTNVRMIVSDPKRTIPIEPLVLTPQEVEERLAMGDQFIEEIITKGEVLYAA